MIIFYLKNDINTCVKVFREKGYSFEECEKGGVRVPEMKI